MTNDEKRFWEFLAILREVFDSGVKANLAFWLAVWHGEKARERAVDKVTDVDLRVRCEFAFELGLQLKPSLAEINQAVMSALIGSAVAAILAPLGVKKG